MPAGLAQGVVRYGYRMLKEIHSPSVQTTCRIAILGSANSPYVRALVERGSHVGVTVECVAFADLQAHANASRVSTNLSRYDCVLVRTMPLGSLEQIVFRMDCLQALESGGVPVVNAPRCLETCIDKWLTIHRCQTAGVLVPETVACQTRDAALEAFDALGGRVVVKPLFGGEGRGIMQIDDRDLAWRTFSVLQQTNSVFYVQQYLEHVGYDIRVLLIGDTAWAVRRIPESGEWRTNVARGATMEAHRLAPEELEIARQAATAVCQTATSEGILAVDLLPCVDGSVRVLEVNAVPGWMGLAKALQRDVTLDVLAFLKEAARPCRTRS